MDDSQPPTDEPASTATTVTVAGSKGGVGKTTTSINVAAGLAARGADVALVELDLATANFLDFLDLPLDGSMDTTLHEVLAGEAELEAATYEGPAGLTVVPSGTTLTGYANADVDNLAPVVVELRRQHDVVVIDTGAGVSRQTAEPLGIADAVLLVSTPRVAAIRDAEKTMELASRFGGTVAGLILTKSGTGASPPPARLAAFLDLELLAHVPEDGAVPDSQDRGLPVVMAQPDSAAATAYENVVETVSTLATTDGATDGRSQTASDQSATAAHSARSVLVGPASSSSTGIEGGDRSPNSTTLDADDTTEAPSRQSTPETATVSESDFLWGGTQPSSESDEQSTPTQDGSTAAPLDGPSTVERADASAPGPAESTTEDGEDTSTEDERRSDDADSGAGGESGEPSTDQRSLLGRLTSLFE